MGQYIALSSTNKAAAYSYAAQDFNYVFSTDRVSTFLPQAQTFLSEMVADFGRFKKLESSVSEIGQEILKSEALISITKSLYKLSDEDINALMPPELLGQLRAARQDYANSLKALADGVVGYTQRLDEQAKIILKAWDATEKTESFNHIFGSITVVIDLLTSLGIGGNAITQSIAREWKEINKPGAKYDRLWNGIGLRSGQVGDALQAAVNSGIWLDKLNIKKIGELYEKIQDADVSTGENLKLLLERVKSYEEDLRKRQEPSDPNPFIPL